MKRISALIINLYLLALPTLLWASGGPPATALDRKVPLEGLSGISLFFAESYNNNLWLYAAVATALMGVVGMVIALGTDVILKAIGMEVHKIEHKE